MKKLILLAFAACSINIAIAQSATTYGDVAVQESQAVPIKDITNRLASSAAEINDITIKGTVAGVCQAKGCWMTFKLDNGEEMTVKFKDYAFFMPKDCSGKTAICHGKAFVKTTSVAELKHLAEDAGKSKKVIAKIKKPKQEVRFEADGVILN
jgi:Domain of unknown function (DUF4920)